MKVRERVHDPNPDYFNENYDPNMGKVLRYFRKERGYGQAEEIKQEMTEYIESQGAQIVGKFIVMAHHVEVAEGKLDLEIIVPIDKQIRSYRSFKFHSEFKLEGCIMSRYQGFFLPPEIVYKYMKEYTLEVVHEQQHKE